VLDGIDLGVPEGTIFALLGPNGAGKTTVVQILSTHLAPDSGEARLVGHDLSREPDAVRAAIGVTSQFSAVDRLLTAEENLVLMADLAHLGRAEGRRRVVELLDRFDLADAATMTPATYSGGMRRRLDLAMTLLGEPRIIFLDEPTTGLDPRSRHTMWQIIRDLAADGVTIFLTTQYLEEADRLADRIAVLDRGTLVAEGTAEELKRLVPGGHIELHFADTGELEVAARALGARSRDDDGRTLQIPSDGTVRALRALLDRLDHEAIEVDGLTLHTPDRGHHRPLPHHVDLPWLGANRSRPRKLDPDHREHGPRRRRCPDRRLPADERPGGLAGGRRVPRAVHPRPDMAGCRHGSGGQVAGGRQRLDPAAAVRTVHQQRVRRPQHHAGRGAMVRREPTVYAHDRDAARAPAGTPIGNHAVIALAWGSALALLGYVWARTAYNRDRTPSA